jgi:2-dehydro-3-deoxyphosphogluconate aldolase/(4S)-4-hydroxy-2-oxoglutarate aldolase
MQTAHPKLITSSSEEIRKQIREIGLVASVRVASDDAAMFAAENVFAGGVSVVEITATIPNSDLVIRDLTARFSSLVVGAEVLNGVEEAHSSLDAGAKFLTAPGFDPEVAELCKEREVAFIPGALTPTEIMHANKAGADFVKIFPCARVGGESYLRALKAPLPNVQLIAAGGVTQGTAARLISAGATALGVGEDLIPPQAIRFREGAWIRELASRFLHFVRLACEEMKASG